MTEKKQLGIFWDDNLLYFAESSSAASIIKSFTIPYTQQEDNPFNEIHPLATTILNAFKEQNLSETTVNLSIPTKDIIFRSFVIPWMQPAEIKDVVEFEASKYVPFAISDLYYSFHSATFTEDGVRRIRVSLVAIKKLTLEKYTNILEQAYVEIDIIEPGPLSLLRVLFNKGFVKPEQAIAIVENSGFSSGKIVIANQGVPQFVREFQLKITTDDGTEVEHKLLESSLLNEIRMSLEYFHRQNNQLKINKILLLSTADSSDFVNIITQELKIEAEAVNISAVTNSIEHSDIGHINAFGVSLAENVTMPANFYLYSDKPKAIKISKSTEKHEFNIKAVVASTLICFGLAGGVFFLSNKSVSAVKNKLSEIKQQLGTKANSTTTSFKMRTNGLNNKLKSLNSIRTEGKTSEFLKSIPEALPPGTWITKITVTYPNTIIFSENSSSNEKKPESKSSRSRKTQKPTTEKEEDAPSTIVDIEGYSYSKETSEQFGLINDILKKLQTSKEYSENFKKIILKTIKSTTIDDYHVTYFFIRCE
ncbi:MAG: pilus assembly protein PilM [Candidatus Omnitrophica bacterium]|nr:pilus assembly protein PilM [Candidatus Omnitrophota bacterium]MBU1995677.1 pilus assembly protein PilM [Candidatus Omnitrophota bacterium]MBU4334210.1 pilus assembly protein PilM [Candidatus Omnitrophota bacterium]